MSHTEISGPADGPYGVAIAAGELWTTLVHAGAVVRLTAGSTQRYDLPEASRPMVITPGPGGVWFTRNGDDRIGWIDAEGNIASVVASGAPYGICAGPDDALWCTLMSADQILRITLDGEITKYPTGVDGGFPAVITAGDGDLWFTLNQGNAIGRMTTAGEVTTYPLPTAGAGPVGISAGPEAVWFVELLADQAGRIGFDGKIEEFGLLAGSKPHAVAATADGGCWITLWGSGSLARLDASGTVVQLTELGEGSEPHGLAIDTDGSVWVALENGSLAHIHAAE
ncbi:virginiamycin B lyase [Kribbella sp. NPDC020789]